MITYRRVTATALAILTAGALTAGCTRDPDPAPIASTSTTAPAPGTPSPAPTVDRVSSPTPAPTPLTAAEQNKKNAGNAVVRFVALTDKLSSDPRQSLNKLATVSRGQVIDPWTQILFQQRIKQETQKGTSTVAITKVTYKGNNLYAVNACIDVSKVDVVDKHGKSVVNPDGPRRVSYDDVVQLASDGKFYVVKEKATKTC